MSKKVWGLLLLLALVWGSSFKLMKTGLGAFSGMQVAEIRLVIVALFFVPILWYNHRHLPAAPRDWGLAFLSGLLGSFLPAFLFAVAVQHTNASVVGILNGLTPIFTLLAGAVWLRQGISTERLAGMGLGLAGCVLIALIGNNGHLQLNAYTRLVLLATLCYGLNLQVVKYYFPHLNPVMLTGMTFVTVGPLAMLLLIFSDLSQVTLQPGWGASLGAVVVLGMVGSGIAMIVFNHVLQLASPVVASTVTYLMPPVSVAWGLYDGEPIFLQHFIGMALILAGVYLVNSPATKKQSVRETA